MVVLRSYIEKGAFPAESGDPGGKRNTVSNWKSGTADFVRWKSPAAASIIFALAASGCKKPEAQPPPPPVVQVIELKPAEVPLSTTLIGQLDSPQNVEIRARVEGFVDKMLFIEGTEVKQNDILFELDRKPFVERLSAANGALGEAIAALNKYDKDVARLTPLAERRAIPQQDLDNAQASVEVGKAAIITAKARVESAQLDLGYCEVTAPISGLIGAKQVSLGDLVGKGEPTLMATISTLDPIWFYASVSEVEYLNTREQSLRMGRDVSTLPVTLVTATGKDHPDKGHFVFIDRAVDVKTGTLRVRAEFPNKQKLLRPGMFSRIRVDFGKRPNCLLVPERAIVELQGKSFVWTVSHDGNAHQQPVIVGETIGSDVVINEGVEAGTKVIIEGIQKVREAAPVSVAQPATPHAGNNTKN